MCSLRLTALGGDIGEEILEALAVLFGYDYGDSHAQAGVDSADEAIDFDGPFGTDTRGEAGADPERVGGFDKHAVGADVACAGAENGRAPFNLKIGAVIVARSPATLRPSWIVSTAHDLPVRPLLRTRTIGLWKLDPTL